jgi:enoyl-CoA hydratase/carnithine racemase
MSNPNNRKSFASVTYEKIGRIATITLNRPDRLNAIDLSMPSDIRKAVTLADRDDDVHVIILQGSGRAFCAGYDLKEFAENSSKFILCCKLKNHPETLTSLIYLRSEESKRKGN